MSAFVSMVPLVNWMQLFVIMHENSDSVVTTKSTRKARSQGVVGDSEVVGDMDVGTVGDSVGTGARVGRVGASVELGMNVVGTVGEAEGAIEEACASRRDAGGTACNRLPPMSDCCAEPMIVVRLYPGGTAQPE